MKADIPRLLVSDKKGRILEVPGLEATGMKAGRFFRLKPEDLIKLPPGSELFTLPGRSPVGYSSAEKKFLVLKSYFGTAAFVSPGFTLTYSSSYSETGRPRILPLFAYGSAASYKGEFYVTAICIDRDRRHDPRLIDMNLVRKNAKRFKKAFPRNRLIRHLENCALFYGCPNARNFFLHRYEGPLPVSPLCNARCMGCVSYQAKKACAPSQPRIRFVPTPEEIAEAALFHIDNTQNPILSFGQGCEGEPLLAGDIIEKAIRIIRKNTSNGVINMNTNAGVPRIVDRLFKAGLDSIRVSINSARKEYYMRYYKPLDYRFKDVLESIRIAKNRKGFVSVNYLTMPGFTDSRPEFDAFMAFVDKNRIDMVQWRNLNFDPLRYFKYVKTKVDGLEMLGVKEIIGFLRKEFPRLRMGYFNPAAPRVIAFQRQ